MPQDKAVNTFENGLVRLDNKSKQPKNSYPYALNAVINDNLTDQTSLTNEKGFNAYFTLKEDPYKLIGVQWLGKQEYVFFIKHLEGATSEFNEIWYCDIEKPIKRLVYTNTGLNFQESHEISSTYRINYKTERIVYWVDGLNDDRVINIDDLSTSTLSIELLSIESSYNKAELQVTVGDTGGSLRSGQYFVALSYSLGESFSTTPFSISQPISIASENYFPVEAPVLAISQSANRQFGATDGDLPSTPTKKALNIKVTDLDQNFDNINIIVVYNDHSTNIIKTVRNIPIKGLTEVTYTYTGQNGEEDTSIDLNSIVVDSIKYYGSEVISQKENRLIRGNSKLKATNINYQAIANGIKVGYKITEELVFQDSIINRKHAGEPSTTYDPKKLLPKQHSISPSYLANTANPEVLTKSFMRDEIYSLGVGFELEDGTETDVFHIPGRLKGIFSQSTGTGEYNASFVGNQDWDDDWQTRNTAVKYSDTEGELGYWRSQEIYSDGLNYPTNGEKNGINKSYIRHHRMPSDILEPIYRTEITGDPNTPYVGIPYKIYKRHLGLIVSNIVIPEEYRDLIKKIKIFYTPRDITNKSILSKGLAYTLDTVPTPDKQNQQFNYKFFADSPQTTLEFISPEVNFNFKQSNLSSSKMKVCGIDKGYVSYAGNEVTGDSDGYLIRTYNNELHDKKGREQGFISGMCFYNQRAIPSPHLYSIDVNKVIYLDNNFVGSTEGFDIDFTGGQKTSLIELTTPITLVPLPLTESNLNVHYPTLLYPNSSSVFPSILYNHLLDGTTDLQDNLAYDTVYYVSLVNPNSFQYGQIQQLEYINSGAVVLYTPSADPVSVTINTGDTYIDVHHFKKTWIELKDPENIDFTSGGASDVEEDARPQINEYAAASYGSFFVETDLNIRMRREGPADDEKYFPKSFYAGSKMRDYGRSIDEEEFYFIEPGYNTQYIKQYFANIKTQAEFIASQNNDTRYTTRLIYSDKQSLETKTDNYRITRVNNYRDLPLDRGPLSGLFTRREKLYALTRDSLFDIYASNQTIKSENGDNITVGTGEFFANEPTELISIKGGFGGTSSKYSLVETPYGYLFVDRFKNKCILFGEQLVDLNTQGLNEHFNLELYKQFPEMDNGFDNPINAAGISSMYDPKLERIIITKKDYKLLDTTGNLTFDNGYIYRDGALLDYKNPDVFEDLSFTVSFNPVKNKWISYHSYIPDNYIPHPTDFVIYDGDMKVSDGDNYQSDMPFIIETVMNENPMYTKTLDSITVNSDTFKGYHYNNVFFDKLWVYTTDQISGEIVLNATNLTRKEKNWNINRFNDISRYNNKQDLFSTAWSDKKINYYSDKLINLNAIDPNKEWYKRGRFRDKYVVIRFFFNNYENSKIICNFIASNYRLSKR